MMLKKFVFTTILAIATTIHVGAKELILCDFEQYEIGTEYPLWNFFDGSIKSKAIVEADPTNANNKVLHVYLKEWNTYVPFNLPDELSGPNLVAKKDYVTLRLLRSESDENEWKKFMICQGKVRLYEDEGYPSQGGKGVWQSRTYSLPETSDATGTDFALGLHSDASDYYIDDILLKGEYDDYHIADNDTIDISGQNSSSTYASYSNPVLVPIDKQITFITSRYTYLNSKMAGEGTVNILSGGERTYIGTSDKSYADGTAFKGVTHVYPHTALSGSNGFYGLVWMHNGKTFNVDAILSNPDDIKANNYFENATLVMHKGTTLAAESGVRGMRIGHLEMEEGSQLYGYMKSKANNNSFYLIGGNGNDALLAGKMSPYADNSSMLLGLIKEGTGTYRITGNENNLTGGIRVIRGGVMINGKSRISTLYVMKDGIAGGLGTTTGESQVYGILQPGDNGIGCFSQTGKMTLRPSARIDCQIKDSANYDVMNVNGAVTYYNIGQDFVSSDKNPRLRIYLDKDANVKVGDQFVIFKAKSKENYNDTEWDFDIRYPKSYTWDVKQYSDTDGFKVIATVVSLTYSGQGNVDYDDEGDEPDTSSDDGSFDLTKEKTDATPLRKYADDNDMLIGTCVPVWTINVDDDNNARSALIAKQFNMVVCENEMKFDATEPSQNEFNYYHGDRLVNYAMRHNMYVRGHALAWHSQVPAWLTSDGTKNSMNRSRAELLAILKNHITNVVGHWKGKVKEWDVANEVLDDNQTTIYSNPEGYDLRPSVWATGIGEDFLDSAFVWTHQIDPDAKLILNDYGVEGKGWAKSEAFFNLARRLRASGIPIDGVGLQCHMDANLNYTGVINDNVARICDDGFLCRITELDLGIDANTSDNLAMQADAYYKLARIAMRYPNCCTLLIWGISDDLTWRTGKRPLLYDADLNAKPAYWGVHAALRQAASKEITNVENIEIEEDKRACSSDVYNLSGQRVGSDYKGMVISNGRKLVMK